jgi:hypothetical protein
MKFIKFSKWTYYIFVVVVIFSGCNDEDKNIEDLPIYGGFSFMDKSFNMNVCEITNYGKTNGLYTFEVNLTNNKDIEIYIKLFSITKNIYGYEYLLGSASQQYSSESYLKIGSDVYLLSEGTINLYDNVITHNKGGFIFRMNCNTTSGNPIEGSYEGIYEYIDKSAGTSASNPIGSGSFTFSYYSEETYPLTNGSLFYKGFNTKEQKRIYELFLTNNEEDYLQFSIQSESILGIDLYSAYYTYPDSIMYFSAPYPPLWTMCYGYEKNQIGINEGLIGIKKSDNNYQIDVQCAYHIYKSFPIIGSYMGGLYFHDFSTDLINYKNKNYQIKELELSYKGIYQDLYQYDLLIKTEQNDEIILRLFTNDDKLNGYYGLRLIRKEILQDMYESFIKIKDEPSLGFFYTGEMTIDTSQEKSFIRIDIIGMDEGKNILNIIYHGNINIQK